MQITVTITEIMATATVAHVNILRNRSLSSIKLKAVHDANIVKVAYSAIKILYISIIRISLTNL